MKNWPVSEKPEVAVAGCHILPVGGCRETGMLRQDPLLLPDLH